MNINGSLIESVLLTIFQFYNTISSFQVTVKNLQQEGKERRRLKKYQV